MQISTYQIGDYYLISRLISFLRESFRRYSSDIDSRLYKRHTALQLGIWTFTCISQKIEIKRPISNHSTGQRYHDFFDLIIQIYCTHFSSTFCRNCQIQCFLHTVNAISKRLKCLSHVFASNCNLNSSTIIKSLEYQQQCSKISESDNSCKKQKENEYDRSEFSDQKVHDTGLYPGLKFALNITFIKTDFL